MLKYVPTIASPSKLALSYQPQKYIFSFVAVGIVAIIPYWSSIIEPPSVSNV